MNVFDISDPFVHFHFYELATDSLFMYYEHSLSLMAFLAI